MDDERAQPGVVLGFGGTWGYAAGELTSPARAAAAGTFTDSSFDPDTITELRVHGVSGSNGPTMLEHPTVLQVAGDSTTMFYRRWSPAGGGDVVIPWKSEAYSWGGLTEKPLASAAWILIAPFMLYNVAHFALPPAGEHRLEDTSVSSERPASQRLTRDRPHAFAQRVLRVLAFTATLQFMVAVVAVLVNTFALQARAATFPSWLKWYQHWTVHERVALAVAVSAAVIGGLWWVSAATASKYEGRVSCANPAVNAAWPLTQPGFWKGKELVDRQRHLHAAGALAFVALIVARPTGSDIGFLRWAVSAVAATVLVLVAGSLLSNVADRHDVALNEAGSTSRTRILSWSILAVGAASTIASAFSGGWPGGGNTRPITVDGFTNIIAILLAGQMILLLVLAVAVLLLREHAPSSPNDPAGFEPFFGGHLTTLLAALAVCLGGLWCSLITLFATRLVGAPVPTGIPFDNAPRNSLQIPWPIYAFAAAPLGLVVGLVVVAIIVWATMRANVSHGLTKVAANGRSVSPVAADYEDPSDPGSAALELDGVRYKKGRRRVARAWAIGLIVEQAGVLVGVAVAGMLLAIYIGEIFGIIASHHDTTIPPVIHGLVSLESVAGLFIAGVLLAMMRSVYSNSSRRKTLGALWDVATFWPRAAHPLAPPCYAERAVPELVDRIRILTGTVDDTDPADPANAIIQAHVRNSATTPQLTIPTGELLLTGYSQGAVLAPAVIAQLPPETLDHVAMLTLASPARRLYGRAFPGYFGPRQLETLGRMLDIGHEVFGRRRWKNLVRKSDYIGSWVFGAPEVTLGESQLEEKVDQPCWDPVSLAPDADPTPPPIHYHSDFFADPRAFILADRLRIALTRAPRP